jgi:hypothetical protein
LAIPVAGAPAGTEVVGLGVVVVVVVGVAVWAKATVAAVKAAIANVPVATAIFFII